MCVCNAVNEIDVNSSRTELCGDCYERELMNGMAQIKYFYLFFVQIFRVKLKDTNLMFIN